jgi:hypothetical protein
MVKIMIEDLKANRLPDLAIMEFIKYSNVWVDSSSETSQVVVVKIPPLVFHQLIDPESNTLSPLQREHIGCLSRVYLLSSDTLRDSGDWFESVFEENWIARIWSSPLSKPLGEIMPILKVSQRRRGRGKRETPNLILNFRIPG